MGSRGGLGRQGRKENALRPVRADAVPGGIDRRVLVDRRKVEVEPEAVLLDGEGAAARQDRLIAVRGKPLLAHGQKNPLERAPLLSRAVEEEGHAGARLPEGPGRHEAHDRRRGQPRHGADQQLVRAGQDHVVEPEDQEGQARRRRQQRPPDRRGGDTAAPHCDDLRIAREPAHADEHAQEKRHGDRQHDDPGDREQKHPGDLAARRVPADEEIRQQEERSQQEQKRVRRESQEERRPRLSKDGPGEQAHAAIVGGEGPAVNRRRGARAPRRYSLCPIRYIM